MYCQSDCINRYQGAYGNLLIVNCFQTWDNEVNLLLKAIAGKANNAEE